MTRPFLCLCTALFAIGGNMTIASLAHAQEIPEIPAKRAEDGTKFIPKIDPCLITREEIIPLRLPDFDQAAQWKKLSGKKGEDIARAMMGVRDGGQIAIGQARVIDDQKNISPTQIRMMRTNSEGKMVVETWVPFKDLKNVRDAVLVKDRVVVLTEQDQLALGGNDMALVSLNGVGEIKEEHKISDRASLIPYSMTTLRSGETFVVAAKATNAKHPEESTTVILWIDKSGRVLSRKEYLPGIKTQAQHITYLADDTLLLTGRVKTDNGRDAGWIMKLSSYGDIIFQRPYARGTDSTLRAAIQTGDGNIIAVGDTIPNNGTDKAAWIIKVDSNGNPVWQKYLTGRYIYGARDLVELSDGRVSVLLSGQVTGEGGRSHARVVTLSPQGIVVADESFVEGSGILPTRIISQNDRRTVLGMAETGFSQKDVTEDTKYMTYDLWVMGLAETPPSPYVCKATRTQELDTLP